MPPRFCRIVPAEETKIFSHDTTIHSHHPTILQFLACPRMHPAGSLFLFCERQDLCFYFRETYFCEVCHRFIGEEIIDKCFCFFLMLGILHYGYRINARTTGHGWICITHRRHTFRICISSVDDAADSRTRRNCRRHGIYLSSLADHVLFI